MYCFAAVSASTEWSEGAWSDARYWPKAVELFDGRLWTDEEFHRQTFAFWKQLADRLRNHAAVVGYNILNEPHPERFHGFESGTEPGFEAWLQKSRGTPADLDLFYQRVVAAIREVDRARSASGID